MNIEENIEFSYFSFISERRKRWSDSYKEVSISDDEDEVDKAELKKTTVGTEDKLKVKLYFTFVYCGNF